MNPCRFQFGVGRDIKAILSKSYLLERKLRSREPRGRWLCTRSVQSVWCCCHTAQPRVHCVLRNDLPRAMPQCPILNSSVWCSELGPSRPWLPPESWHPPEHYCVSTAQWNILQRGQIQIICQTESWMGCLYHVPPLGVRGQEDERASFCIYHGFQCSVLWNSRGVNEWTSVSVFVSRAFSWALSLSFSCFVLFQCISLFSLTIFIFLKRIWNTNETMDYLFKEWYVSSLFVVGIGNLKVDVRGKLSFTRKILSISLLTILSFLFLSSNIY